MMFNKDLFTPRFRLALRIAGKLADAINFMRQFFTYDMIATYFVLALLCALLYVAFAG